MRELVLYVAKKEQLKFMEVLAKLYGEGSDKL